MWLYATFIGDRWLFSDLGSCEEVLCGRDSVVRAGWVLFIRVEWFLCGYWE